MNKPKTPPKENGLPRRGHATRATITYERTADDAVTVTSESAFAVGDTFEEAMGRLGACFDERKSPTLVAG